MIDVGSGPAIVLIPGIQGRWEWMRPAVDALAKHWRVVTCSLPGEPGSDTRSSDAGFDQFIEHVDNMMDAAGISRAVICGVSFGGLVALRYAARRSERVHALILVSTPGPLWKPAAHQSRYMRWPILTLPLFLAGAVKRGWSEVRVTIPDPRTRLAFCGRLGMQVMAAPGIPSRMGRRARLAAAEHFEHDCAQITTPTLVIAGERELDKVVSPDDTIGYVNAIRTARFEQLHHTGHLGTISAPEEFADIVSKFLNGLTDSPWLTTSA